MAARGRSGLIVVIAVLILAGGLFLWIRHKTPGISEREYATQLLAEFLKTAAKPKSVLVIGNPFTDLPNHSSQAKEFERAGIAGLKNGFGATIPVKVAHPAINPSVLADPTSVHIDSKSSTPLSFVIESSAFDDVLDSVRAALNARNIVKPGIDWISWGPGDMAFDIERHSNSPFKTIEDVHKYVIDQLKGYDVRLPDS